VSETVLITGSNRGLGLEWARQYAEAGWRVYATCRHPQGADELQALAAGHDNLTLHCLDVTDAAHIERLSRELSGTPLDLLVNNAGVYFERWNRDPLGSIVYREWEETFRVNTLGPMRMCEAFADHLAHSRRRLAVSINSHMGSIADISDGRNYAYRSSKAALNATMKGVAAELQPRGVGVLLLHPGWVRTRMGGDEAPYTPQESVAGMRALVERFSMAQSGRFFRFDGSELPW